jgi:hypothetical protein
MKYAVEMVSGAMIYIPNFIKIGSGIQKLMGAGGIHRHTDSMEVACSYMRSSCCLCVSPPPPAVVARQRLGRHVTAATNTHGPCRIKYLIRSEKKGSE